MKKINKDKPHICYDMLPADEAEAVAWAARAMEVNPQNAPAAAVQSFALMSVCMSGVEHSADEIATYFTPLEMALLTSKKWRPGQEITFGFIRATSTIAAHARTAVSEIMKYANLKFREVNAASAMIRVSDSEQGAWSYLGTDALGIPSNKQTLNLARSWADLATAIHEFCHAVGMVHEHQSAAAPEDLWNEDAVYRYYSGPPNNWSREMIRSNVLGRYSTNQTQFTAWDRQSIMLYPLDRALVKRAEYATGWNKELSSTDKAFLAAVYPGSDITTPPDKLEVRIPKAGKWVWQGE